ncbi:uncharacterized protein LOC113351740 [Papaver somniferum]|uniref:uncharacterized protein LOC113351740 n=1 Tax=Papaver somniferum TaxID=3469 RepID=UPI000E6FCACB|nr:uncharacterized protein LOC113351740 [Papaver somniferum]
MCNGAFIDKSANEAWTFLIEVAERLTVAVIREPKNIAPVANVHRIEFDFEGNTKIASLARRANALYHKQENNPYSQTYNPWWRINPNFSWCKGVVQGGTTSNNQGYSYPRNSQVQSHSQYPVKKKLSFEDSVGLLTQNLLQLQKTTDQRFTSLELKIGQICDALNEREKRKLPSQPQQIQKSAFQASTSTCNETSHNQVNAVTTLHSGKVVENNIGVPQSLESKSDSPVHTTPQKTPVVEKESEHDSDSKNFTDVNGPAPSNVPVAPFPQRLRKLHVDKRAFLTEQVSSIILNKTPPKFKDPGLGELNPIHVTLQLADRSVKIPRGRPFLATSNDIINYRNGVLNLSFGNMIVEINVFNISQQPMDCNDSDFHEINMIESLIQESLPDILSVDPLQAV